MPKLIDRPRIGAAYPYGRNTGGFAFVTGLREKEVAGRRVELVDSLIISSGAVKRQQSEGVSEFVRQVYFALPDRIRALQESARRSDDEAYSAQLKGSMAAFQAMYEQGENLPACELGQFLRVRVLVQVPGSTGDEWGLIDSLAYGDCETAYGSHLGWDHYAYETTWPLLEIGQLATDERVRIVALEPSAPIASLDPADPDNRVVPLLQYLPWVGKEGVDILRSYPSVTEWVGQHRVREDAWLNKARPAFLDAVVEAKLPQGYAIGDEGLDPDGAGASRIDCDFGRRTLSLVVECKKPSEPDGVRRSVRFVGALSAEGSLLSLKAFDHFDRTVDLLEQVRQLPEPPVPRVIKLGSRRQSRAVSALYEKFQRNPIDDRQVIVSDGPVALAVVAVSPDINGRGLHLSEIITFEPKQGYASRALEIVKALADEFGEQITLTAKKIGTNPTNLSTRQLKDWYLRHGFVNEYGNSSDGYDMHRDPQPRAELGKAVSAGSARSVEPAPDM